MKLRQANLSPVQRRTLNIGSGLTYRLTVNYSVVLIYYRYTMPGFAHTAAQEDGPAASMGPQSFFINLWKEQNKFIWTYWLKKQKKRRCNHCLHCFLAIEHQD